MLDQLAPGSSDPQTCMTVIETRPELKRLLKQVGFRTAQFFGVAEAGFDRQVRPSQDRFEIGVIAEG